MSQVSQQELDQYADLTATQQAQVREKVHDTLTQLRLQIQGVHSNGDRVMARLQQIIAFASQTAVQADFQSDGTFQDAVTARDNIDEEIVDYANRQARISGATRSG